VLTVSLTDKRKGHAELARQTAERMASAEQAAKDAEAARAKADAIRKGARR
jgi:hypothetical protein